MHAFYFEMGNEKVAVANRYHDVVGLLIIQFKSKTLLLYAAILFRIYTIIPSFYTIAISYHYEKVELYNIANKFYHNKFSHVDQHQYF